MARTDRAVAFLRCILAVLLLAVAPSRLLAQSANIHTPAHGSTHSSQQVYVEIRFCGYYYGLNTSSLYVSNNSTDITSNFSFVGLASGCPPLEDGDPVQVIMGGTITLGVGTNSLYFEMWDNYGYYVSASGSTLYHQKVSVTPKGGTGPTVGWGQSASQTFTISNPASQARTFNLSPSCNSGVTNCAVSQSSVNVGAGSSANVNVSFTGNGPADPYVYLTATDAAISGNTDQGSAYVIALARPVAHVTVTRTGAATIGVGQTSGFTARTYASDWSELTGRSISWSGSNVSVSPGSGTSVANTTATGTAAGTGTVSATSEGVTGNETVAVVTPTYAVAVATVSSNPINPAAGSTSTGTIQYRITNNNVYVTPSSTYNLSVAASGSAPLSSCTRSPTSVTLAPGEQSGIISVSCNIGSVTSASSGTVTLTASTSSPGSASSSYGTTVNVTPYLVVSVVPDASSQTAAGQATSGSATFRIYNSSVNAGGSASIPYTRACSGVTTCSGSSSVTVSEGSYATVTVNYGVQWLGTSGSVGVTATLGNSHTGTTTVNATPVYAVTVTRENASQTLGAAATSGSTRFTITNASTNTGVNTTFNLNASCSGTFVTGCSASPSTITLGDQSSSSTNAVTLNYSTGYTGQSGSVTLTASASSPGSSSHAQSTSLAATPAYSVVVTPASPVTLGAQTWSGSTSFTIQNNSTNTDGSAASFTLTPSCSGVVSCSGNQSVSLAQGASTSRSFSYNVSASGTTGGVQVTAASSSPSMTNNGTATINTTPHYAVSVAVSSSQNLAAQSTSGSTQFLVTNTGTNLATSTTFNISASCGSGIASSCSPSVSSVTLGQGNAAAPTVSFNVGAVGTGGSVQLTAANTSPSVSGSETQTLTITPYYSATVYQGGTNPQTLNERVTSGSSTFWVENNGRNLPGSVTFLLEPYGCSGVTSCSVSGSQITLAQGAANTVDVNYSVSSTLISGTAGVRAWTNSPVYLDNAGTKTINTTPSYSIAVTPGSGADTTAAGFPGTYTATITNTSWNTQYPITASLATPGCSGSSYVSTCAVGSNSNSIAQGATTPAVTLSYNAVALGTHSSLALNASGSVSQGGTVTPTNGAVNLVVSSGGTIAAALNGINPEATIDRSGCLAIAAGQNAAYECSDLRLVHSLPRTTTMGKARVPRLIYNSRHANPSTLLAANVTFSGILSPDSVEATVTVLDQAVSVVKSFAWNSSCSAQACRIVVPVPATPTMATALYQARLVVKAKKDGYVYATSAEVSDTIAIINRAKSPYGAGWWVEGLETISHYASKALWVGGDGSTRLYVEGGTPGVYVAQAFDRPDTLARVVVGSDTLWRRHLESGGYVEFNHAGKHMKTRNAMGWETAFAYHTSTNTQPLASITLPVSGGGPTMQYTFAYGLDGSDMPALDSVVAPGSRRVLASRAQHYQITGLTDPENQETRFGYMSSSDNRVTARRNKLGDTTYFAYDAAGALNWFKLSLHRTNGNSEHITTVVRAAETRSSADTTAMALTTLANVFTRLEGPRDTTDNTAFYVNRWGAPDTVVNALGEQTRVWRQHGTYPALVTKSVSAAGLETRAHFNARALVDSTEVIDPYEAACNGTSDRSCIAVTKYVWDAKWREAVSTRSPTGVFDTVMYNDTVPKILWTQRGTSSNRRVHYRYYSNHQVRAVAAPLVNPDSVEYDPKGNVSAMRRPSGHWTVHRRDGLGRDSLTLSAIDSGDVARDGADNIKAKSWTEYDVMGRVKETRSDGPASTYTGAQTILVRNVFDDEGNVTRVARRSIPDPAGIDTLITQYVYDAAGRVKVTKDGLNNADSTRYDEAGNVTYSRSRQGDAVTMSYDELNRLKERITPARALPSETLLYSFPLYATTIPADTARFTYTARGMATANNADARIARTYAKNGALRAETQQIRNYSGSTFSQHVYNLTWLYDLDGRRTRLVRPYGDSVVYVYESSLGTGELVSLGGDAGTFTFAYDDAGRPSQTTAPGAITETNAYDAGGRLVRRHARGDNYYIDLANDGDSTSVIRADTIRYDGRGKMVEVRSKTDSTGMFYSGLGALEQSVRYRRELYSSTLENVTTDALGHITSRTPLHGIPTTFGYQAGTGRQNTSHLQGTYGDSAWFDAAGNVRVQARTERASTSPYEHLDLRTRSYYGHDNTLRVVDRRAPSGAGAAGATADQLGAFEEYRYDAIGRRVLKRSRRPQCNCASTIERFVWDGDDLVMEMRYPGRDGIALDSLEVDTGVVMFIWEDGPEEHGPPPLDTAYSPHFGVTTYLHGGAIDRPLSLTRHSYGQDSLYFAVVGLVLHYDWRGSVQEATVNGGSAQANGLKMDWPSRETGAYHDRLRLGVRSWVGGLVDEMRDASGFQYMRNRYYDPTSGTFTQEDPIGLAGGMNLYGFAGGDPVTYSDPFGLFELRIVGDDDFRDQIQKEREADPEMDKYLTELEQSKDLFVIAQRPGSRMGLTVGGRSPIAGLPHEQDLVDAAAAELGITDRQVRGIAFVGNAGFVPSSWVAGHEAIHLVGIARRDLRYSHRESIFNNNRRKFLAAGYPFP